MTCMFMHIHGYMYTFKVYVVVPSVLIIKNTLNDTGRTKIKEKKIMWKYCENTVCT